MRTRRIFSVAPLLVVALAFAVVTAACGSSTTGEPAATGEFKRVVVGDLAIRIPAEWRSYDYDFGAGWKGVSMNDPRHEPSDAVIFGFYSQKEPGMTAAELGKMLAESPAPSAVREKLVALPSGIRAYEVRSKGELNGQAFTVLAYALATTSASGSRGYVVLYRATEAQAAHLTQFRASARSIRVTSPAVHPMTTPATRNATALTPREEAWLHSLSPLLSGMLRAGTQIATLSSDPQVLDRGTKVHGQMDAALATFEKCAPTLERKGPAPTRRLRAIRVELYLACGHLGRYAALAARSIDKIDVALFKRAQVELDLGNAHLEKATRLLNAVT